MSTLRRTPIPTRVDPRSASTDANGPNVFGGWFALPAPAKVNLHLEVLGRRDDGFHELETVMAPLRIADRLWLRAAGPEEGLKLSVRGPFATVAPTDERNLVVRALQRLREHASADQGAEVVLEKNIPAEAGLGGGSSDAAAALLLANHAWGLKLDDNALQTVAAETGSDVPFFLAGGAALCRGRGEQVTPIAAPSGCPCVVLKPSVGLSTAAVYNALADAGGSPANAKTEPMLSSLATGDWRAVAHLLFNRLQQPAAVLAEGLDEIIAGFERFASLGWQMTGSGSAFFALTANHRSARRLAARLTAEQRGVTFATQIA